MTPKVPQVRPSDFFIRTSQLDQSAITGLFTGDQTQYVRITKLALRQYLEECFRGDGQFGTFFNKMVTSSVGLIVNENVTEDESLGSRHLQIADYFANVRGAPPQLLIQNGAYEVVRNSLGDFARGWNFGTPNGDQGVQIMDVVPIPITISCMALSERDVEDLVSALQVAFGQYNHFTVNYILKPFDPPTGCYWEVRFPQSQSIGEKGHVPAGPGEARVQIWTIPYNILVEFENSTLMHYRAQPRVTPQNANLQLGLPAYLRIGQECPIVLVNQPKPISVYSNDANVAVVRQRGTHWILVPRHIGTCTIMVTRLTSSPDTGPEILAQQTLEIRAR